MIRHRVRSLLFAGGVLAGLLACATTAQAQPYDPSLDASTPEAYDASNRAPGRVARLAYLDGDVQLAPAGVDSWGSVDINRPVVIGDRLVTGDDGRAVLELGDASVRLDHDTAFDFLNLDQDNVQIELSRGTLNLAVRKLGDGANFEVDTPTVAFVASTPGVYRIDNNPDGIGTIVTVFDGTGVVYGENGASREVAAGQSYRFNDSALASVDVSALPEPDGFDRFCEARDSQYAQHARQSGQYTAPGMIGGEDLYQYGEWTPTPDYGRVWYPTSVPVGWAPYRYGHWAWIAPWGWTWVDNQPWGFAPFHYGRWVYVRNRWGWVPGPIGVRPVYAPALVAFIGGSGVSVSVRVGGGQPVGWFPLGPRDVYVPWFHASRGYFTNVNITNIRTVYVNHTVINNCYDDYRAGRPIRRHGRHDYAYATVPGAVTAVDRDVFVGARPVHPATIKLDRSRLAHAEIAVRPGLNPGKSSLGLRQPTAQPAVLHGREPFAHPVVARHDPPPRPIPFDARERVIATQHGQPLTPVQVSNLQRYRPVSSSRNPHVKLAAVDEPAGTGRRVSSRQPEPIARRDPVGAGHPPPADAAGNGHGNGPTRPPFKNTVRPIQAPVNPIHAVPPRPDELRSARFAPSNRATATLPRAPVIRPAERDQERAVAQPGRLPVVKPVQRAPVANRKSADRPPTHMVRAAPRADHVASSRQAQNVGARPGPSQSPPAQQRQPEYRQQQAVRQRQLQQQRGQQQQQERARQQSAYARQSQPQRPYPQRQSVQQPPQYARQPPRQQPRAQPPQRTGYRAPPQHSPRPAAQDSSRHPPQPRPERKHGNQEVQRQ